MKFHLLSGRVPRHEKNMRLFPLVLSRAVAGRRSESGQLRPEEKEECVDRVFSARVSIEKLMCVCLQFINAHECRALIGLIP